MYYYFSNLFPHTLNVSTCLSLALDALLIVALWFIFQKAGEPGWKCLIPFYNVYTEFDFVFGDGIRFLLLLIPFYNIYLFFKFCIALAKCFEKSAGFGIGIAFLPWIFLSILAFEPYVYLGRQPW